MAEGIKLIKTVISSGNTSHPNVVHWPEDGVSPDHRKPEMNFTHGLIHESTKHLREPVINTGKHPEECSDPHYNMEVSYDKIGIMHLNINGGITQKDSGQTT